MQNTTGKIPTWQYHRFLDEAGDTTFYGKGKTPIIGTEGVSKSFILGMLKINGPLDEVRSKVLDLQESISQDKYFSPIASINKRKGKGGYFLHAKDDPPEVRMLAYRLIASLDCSFEAVVARKDYSIFLRKHNGREAEMYADLLSHLIGTEFLTHPKLVLNLAERSGCTTQTNLDLGLSKAVHRFDQKKKEGEASGAVAFNVQIPTTEPLLNIADYFCWSLQRVWERGETRYYDFLQSQISEVVDLFAPGGYQDSKNRYSPQHLLTEANCLK